MNKALSADPQIAIAGSAANGAMAITMARDSRPDVIVLDIEMPVMDGITALPELLKVSPGTRVIIASTLSLHNAEISMRALALGASDYLAKPSAKSGNEVEVFYRELTDKIKALGGARPAVPPPLTPVTGPAVKTPSSTLKEPPKIMLPIGAPLNPMGIKALAIASSTGGPQALMTLFGQIKGQLQGIPIFITQHMPPTFTTILADHLGKAGSRHCIEARGGETAAPGYAYLAPGNYHMVAEKNANGVTVLRINQEPPENFCRPAADPMLRSLSSIYGNHLAVLVLTGMGQDGMEGAKEVVKQGGSVIAQDEASCVVYGMPKAVVENKLCKAVLPLPDIGGYLIAQIDGKR